MFDSKSLYSLLSENAKNLKVFIYDSVTSTNDLAKEYATKYPNKEAVIIASKQTAGRGRRGRSFFSPDKTGLYMSIVLRPQFLPELASLLTPCAALCVAKAIECVSDKRAEIKWINDVYIAGKKVSGILCESSLSTDVSRLDYVVVGIGINLSHPKEDFPVEIKDIATTVFVNEIPDESQIARLSSIIINELYAHYIDIENKSFISEYKNRLCMLNCDVDVITPNETYIATAIDIDDDAHLIVKLGDGTLKILDSGEISIKQKIND